jgi:outer membrane autotransporter protein
MASANGLLINPVADLIQDDGLTLWGTVLGGYRDQEAEGAGSDFESWFGGAVIGIDGLAGDGTRLGLMAGAMTGELDADTKSQSIDNENFLAGAYASLEMGRSFLDLSAIGGFATFDSRRRVANNLVTGGVENAKADYDGGFVSPAAEIGTAVDMGGGYVIPSLRARYAGLFLDDYSESGSAANLEVDRRRVDVGELRGQLAFAMTAIAMEGGTLELTFRTGVDGTFGDGGRIDAILLGQSLSFDSGSDTAVAEGFAGLQMVYSSDSGLQLNFGAELGLDTNDSFTANGRLGVIVPF